MMDRTSTKDSMVVCFNCNETGHHYKVDCKKKRVCFMDRTSAKDSMPVVVCFNCNETGHYKVDCKKKIVCFICHEGHKKADCPTRHRQPTVHSFINLLEPRERNLLFKAVRQGRIPGPGESGYTEAFREAFSCGRRKPRPRRREKTNSYIYTPPTPYLIIIIIKKSPCGKFPGSKRTGFHFSGLVRISDLDFGYSLL